MIRIENIYYMLAYAFDILQQKEYKELATEKFENATELLCAILCKGVAIQVKRGLGRAYITKEEALSTPKGKIEINESIKMQSMQKKQMICSYDTCSIDFYGNQIIKTTLCAILRTNTSKARKKEIRKLLLFFTEVSTLELSLINWNIFYDRNNQTYMMLIAICQMLVKEQIQTTKKGSICIREFADEQTMPKLYEKFLLQYFRKEHKQLKVYAPQIKWKLDDGMANQLPIMQSDIVISNPQTNKTLIIDAKYYTHNMQSKSSYTKKTIYSANLYQIFTYVKNWNAKEDETVIGMLLYARTEDEIQPNHRYQMSGNQIYVQTLDLNCKFDKIKEQLDRIAKLV